MSEDNSQIPVIDFERLSLHKADEAVTAEDLDYVGTQIKDAFHNVGFCYLKNFGASDVIDRYYASSLKYFTQPYEEKMKNARQEGINFGYVAANTEKVNPERPGDFKEAFNYEPGHRPDSWSQTEFEQANVDMFTYCVKLSTRILDALSVGLGLNTNFLRDAHKLMGQNGCATTLRSLYYPPIPDVSSLKSDQIRLGEHTDFGSVTMVFQDNSGGLEVNMPGVGYVPATPIPGTVVLNIGALMQRWTSDFLIATEHRIRIPQTEAVRNKPRQSIAFFMQPDDEYVVKCLDGSDKYEPISSKDYLEYSFKRIY